MADNDPVARPGRRSFSPEYKLAILEAYDRLDEPGAKGALLRREGLYSSHIVEWRRARDAGALNALAAEGRKPKRSAEAVELDRLRRQNERLQAELGRTKAALDIMGKAHALLESLSESAASRPQVDAVIDTAFAELAPLVRTRRACRLLGKSHAHPLPPPQATLDAAVVSTDASQRAQRRRAPSRPGRPPPPRPRRPASGPGVGPPARRGHLPGLDLDHVPPAAPDR